MKKDKDGNPIFDKTVVFKTRINIKVVRNLNTPMWEVMFDGEVPGIIMAKHTIGDKVVPLWDLSEDPRGAKANKLHKKLIVMADKGYSIIDMIKYCKSLR
tara:strand:- start:24520 stop:24819 length:300 start_codon:yes stop_codon:yes gene_type:complete